MVCHNTAGKEKRRLLVSLERVINKNLLIRLALGTDDIYNSETTILILQNDCLLQGSKTKNK